MKIAQALATVMLSVAVIAGSATRAISETTVADYDRLKKSEQADLVGRILQNFIDNLQNDNRDKDAQCLVNLYSSPPPGSKSKVSYGMLEFFDLVALARQDEPEKYTIERIVVEQANRHCSSKK